MHFVQLRHYYNQCDPDESLAPTDERNVDLDQRAQGTVRSAKLFEGLLRDFEYSDKPICRLFTGLPGSGKSTELRRLATRLAGPDGLHLFPVIADAEELLDIRAEIDVADVMLAMLYATEVAVLQAEGKKPESAMSEGYFTRFWHWLTTTEVSLNEAKFAITSTVDLVAELKTRPTLRQRVREAVSRNLNSFLADVAKQLQALETRVEALPVGAGERPYSGVLIVVDSLEKLAGTTTTWRDVLNSAEVFFRRESPWLDLPVHTIYTVPPALLMRIPDIVFMPMIKVRSKDGSPYEPGIDAARAVVYKRIPPESLESLLGEQWEARVSTLIGWSGGYPRELVRLLRQCLRYKTYPLSEEDFQRVFDEVAASYRNLVYREDYAWLLEVARQRWVTVDTEKQHPSAARMLAINAVLYYPNGEGFYDLHPAVYRIPELQAALAEGDSNT